MSENRRPAGKNGVQREKNTAKRRPASRQEKGASVPSAKKRPAAAKTAASKNTKNSLKERRERKNLREYVNSSDRLSEFSDGYNDFYTDEIEEKKIAYLDEKREKKAKKKERKKKPASPGRRKLGRILSYIAILTVVLVAGVVLSLTVLFKTQNYEVTGITHYTDQEMIDACGIDKGENIFLAPKKPAEQKIKEKFAYVEDVDVSFRIPDTITISVEEAVEAYLVKLSDTQFLLVSTKGRILDTVADTAGYNLPLFIGPALVSGNVGDYVEYEDPTVMDIIDDITTVFADNGYQGITELDATSSADISFTYDGRIKVKLGLPEALSYKIRTAMTIITEKIDVNTVSRLEGVLDVSRCNDTKKSYFNEQPLMTIGATEPSTEDPTAADAEWAGDGGWTGDGEWDYGDWEDDGYSDDYNAYSDDYSDDWSYDDAYWYPDEGIDTADEPDYSDEW